MIDREIRDLTKAIKDLVKVTTALNGTLVTIERTRIDEKSEYCQECKAAVCIPGIAGLYRRCPCCGVDHEPGAIPGTGYRKP